jgi:hypothetical protein
MTRLVEILVAVNAALGIVTWLSVRWAGRRKQERATRTIDVAPRQLPPPSSDDRSSDDVRDVR